MADRGFEESMGTSLSFPSLSREMSFAVPGFGPMFAIKSRKGIRPEFLKAVPAKAGRNLFSAKACTRPFCISSAVREPLSRYLSIRASSPSAAASKSFSLAASTACCISAGMGPSFSGASPWANQAFPLKTSMTPLKPAPLPMGMVTGTGSALSFSFISARALLKSARSPSRRVMKTPLGLFLPSRFRHSFMVSI